MRIRLHRMTSTNVGWRHGVHGCLLCRIRITRCAYDMWWKLRMRGEWLAGSV